MMIRVLLRWHPHDDQPHEWSAVWGAIVAGAVSTCALWVLDGRWVSRLTVAAAVMLVAVPTFSARGGWRPSPRNLLRSSLSLALLAPAFALVALGLSSRPVTVAAPIPGDLAAGAAFAFAVLLALRVAPTMAAFVAGRVQRVRHGAVVVTSLVGLCAIVGVGMAAARPDPAGYLLEMPVAGRLIADRRRYDEGRMRQSDHHYLEEADQGPIDALGVRALGLHDFRTACWGGGIKYPLQCSLSYRGEGGREPRGVDVEPRDQASLVLRHDRGARLWVVHGGGGGLVAWSDAERRWIELRAIDFAPPYPWVAGATIGALLGAALLLVAGSWRRRIDGHGTPIALDGRVVYRDAAALPVDATGEAERVAEKATAVAAVEGWEAFALAVAALLGAPLIVALSVRVVAR